MDWIARAGPKDGSEQQQRALASRVLAELLELPATEAAAALEYIRRLRSLGVAMPTQRPGAEMPARPDDAPHIRHDDDLRPARDNFLDHARPDPAPPHHADVAVRALGPLEVVVGGTPLRAWGGTRVRTAFQYLLLQRRPQHREVLMELLWPGYPFRSARNNLNVCMYGLRRALSVGGCKDYVVHRDGYYALNVDLGWSVDRVRFIEAAERSRRAASSGQPDTAVLEAQRAVDEYRGPLFDGDPTADWWAIERTALADLFAQTLELLARLRFDRGEVDAAQRAVQHLLREDGCRESAHRLLMVCYASRNQRDLVARQYRSCVTKLREELDIAASHETVRLFQHLTDSSKPASLSSIVDETITKLP